MCPSLNAAIDTAKTKATNICLWAVLEKIRSPTRRWQVKFLSSRPKTWAKVRFCNQVFDLPSALSRNSEQLSVTKMFPIELELVANQRFRRKQPGEVDFGLERSWRSLHFFVAAGSAPSTTCQHLSWWYHKHCTKSCKSQRLGVWKNPAQKRRSSNWTVKCDLASENGHFYARSPKLIYLWLSMRPLTAPSVSMTWVQSTSTVLWLNRRSDGPDRTFNLRQDPLEAILVIFGRRALIFLF